MEVYDQIPAFFDPMSGSGALQVMAIDVIELKSDFEKFKSSIKGFPWLTGEKLIDKMMVFLHMQEIKATPETLRVYTRDDMDFIPFEYTLQGRFYMTVMMEKDDVVLLAIYNSATQPDKIEAGIIGEIIKSIKISGKVRLHE
jgi:hypothetical protein